VLQIRLGYADSDIGGCFNFSHIVHTTHQGHDYKLFKKHNVGIRSSFLRERVVNANAEWPTCVLILEP